MRAFIKDMIIYPFASDKVNNRFSQFLTTIFKDYPAFLWTKPTWKKVLVLPFLLVYELFRTSRK